MGGLRDVDGDTSAEGESQPLSVRLLVILMFSAVMGIAAGWPAWALCDRMLDGVAASVATGFVAGVLTFLRTADLLGRVVR